MSNKIETLESKPEKQKNTRRKGKDLHSLSKALKANLQRRKAAAKSLSLENPHGQ